MRTQAISRILPRRQTSSARSSADYAVIPLVILCSVLPLVWFASNWQVNQDGSLYLLTGMDLVTGQGYTFFDPNAPLTIRGPVLPLILGGLIWVLGPNVETLAWAVRLLALANPLLMYLLIKRLAGPAAGLLAAGLVALMGYSATLVLAFNVDAVALSVFLLWVVVFLFAVDRNSTRLALLAGVALGAAILTKETTLAALPLALAAVPLLGWNIRGAVWHYVGVLAICVPWWVVVWMGTGDIYLVGRVPPELLLGVGASLAVLALVLATLLRTRLGTFSDNKRSLSIWVVWLALFGWIVLLSILLLSTRDQHQPRFQHISFFRYFNQELLLVTPLWFLLPAALLYVVWKAFSGHRLWAFYLSLLAIQIPVLSLVLVERWIARQFILPQTLLYGALAAFAVDVAWLALRRPNRRVMWGVAGVLLVLLLYSVADRSRTLLATPPISPEMRVENDLNQAVVNMSEWLSDNLPPGAKIATTRSYSRQVIFQDARKHEWSSVWEYPFSRAQVLQASSCSYPASPDEKCPLPRQLVEVSLNENCDARATSMRGLLWQMKRAQATYLLISDEAMAWLPHLTQSRAFEVMHISHLSGAQASQNTGLALLKRTSEQAKPAPVVMNTSTFENALNCMRRAPREDVYAGVRSTFPYGIYLIGSPGSVATINEEVSRIYSDSQAP